MPPFVLLLLLFVAPAQTLSTVYANGPIPLSPAPSSTLYFTVRRPLNEIDLALIVQLPPPSATAWLSLGITDPSSGGLRGADLYTVQFSPNSAGQCDKSDDEYVPFAPFPLYVSPQALPRRDSSADETWTLKSCLRHANGTLELEVTRKIGIAANNSDDRPIAAGVQNVVHVYGEGGGYFAQNRSSTEVVFFNEDDGEQVVQKRALPDDVSGNITLVAGPDGSKNLTCFASRPLQLKPGRMVVAAEALVKSANVTRIVVYGCEDTDFDFSRDCAIESRPFVLGLDTKARCNSAFYSCALTALISGALRFPNRFVKHANLNVSFPFEQGPLESVDWSFRTRPA